MVALLALAPAGRANAHAIVQSTEPRIDAVVERSPAAVVMHFNEPVEVAFGAIRVYDTTASRVDDGRVDHVSGDATSVRVGLERGLPEGTYTVTWRVISADSHVIQEAFVFHVGAPGAKPQGVARDVLTGEGKSALQGVLLGLSRALGYAGLIVLVGGFVFSRFSWRRSLGPGDWDGLHAVFRSRWNVVMLTAWIVALIATLAAILFQGAQAAGLGVTEVLRPAVFGEVMKTRFARLMLVRAAVLGLGGFAWALMRRRRSNTDARAISAPEIVALACIGVGLVATSFAGHAGSSSPVAVNVPVDALHLSAVGAWIGGLTMLIAVAFPAFSAAGEERSLVVAAPVVSRYSNMALVAVVVIVVTGLWQSWIEVQALRALGTTSYGVTLLTKLALFVPLVGLGAVNRRRAKPRIDRAVQEGTGDTGGLRLLRRLVAVEVALAVAIVAVTAFLVNLPPAKVAAGISGPFITDVAIGDESLNMIVDPNQVGENEIHLTVTDQSGAPVEVKQMRVLFTMPQESIGPLEGKGTKLAPGHFVVQGRQLSVPGRWTLEAVARVSRFDELRTRVSLIVNR